MPGLTPSPRALVALCLLLCNGITSAGSPEAWSQLAGGPHRPGITPDAISLGSQPLWSQCRDVSQAEISFTPQAGVVVAAHRVYATGRVSVPGGPPNEARIFCFHATTGQPLWSTPTSSPWLDSYSTPCIDIHNEVVIHASQRTIAAYDMHTGVVVWSRLLEGSVVSASPVLTTDRPGQNRVLITDYDGFGGEAALYCINVDPFDADINPFLPGEIIWSACIGGSSGNSPAFLPAAQGGEDLVYVASIGNYADATPGSIFAFNINGSGTALPVWSVQNPAPHGFFGGLTILPARAGNPPYLYAASYAFYGGIDGANLVKVDASSGELKWSVPCNRTSSIPIVLADGRILLSTGIDLSGTGRSLELFADLGQHAARIWNSALATWIDVNQDGDLDGNEFQPFGGWSTQPVVSVAGGVPLVAAGLISNAGQNFQSCERLDLLDLSISPGDPMFRRQHVEDVGASPAVWAGILFTTGETGLVAYGSPPTLHDVNQDGRETIDDLHAWEQGDGLRDVNFDGEVSSMDRLALIRHARRLERVDMEVDR